MLDEELGGYSSSGLDVRSVGYLFAKLSDHSQKSLSFCCLPVCQAVSKHTLPWPVPFVIVTSSGVVRGSPQSSLVMERNHVVSA